MRRIMTMCDRDFATAVGRRTPGEVTTGVFSRQASVGRRLLVLLVCLMLVMTGCSEETEAKLDGNKGWTIPVVYGDEITQLRQDAAADGKVLVIDCWATWCGSCVAMFPHLHNAIKERGDGVLLVSLTFDEGEDAAEQAAQFLFEQQARENAYRAAEGYDPKEAIAKALSPDWDGGALPAVFVYKPDGTVALEFTETRGEVQDWVDEIAGAVDAALADAESQPGQ